MNALCKQFFARAGFSVNHNRGIGLCRLPTLLYHVFHRIADMHNIFKVIPCCQRALSAGVLARIALGNQLCLQLDNLFIERIDSTPVLHDAVSAQHLPVLDNRIGIRRNIYILIISRGVDLPPS